MEPGSLAQAPRLGHFLPPPVQVRELVPESGDCSGAEAKGPWAAQAAMDLSGSPDIPEGHNREAAVAHSLAADRAAVRNLAADNPEDSRVADSREAFPAADTRIPEVACIPEDSLAADIPVADTGNLGDSPAADILEALARVAPIP